MEAACNTPRASGSERIGIRERLRRARIGIVSDGGGSESRHELEMLRAATASMSGFVGDIDGDRTARIDRIDDLLRAMRSAISSVIEAEREQARMLEQFIGRIEQLLQPGGAPYKGADASEGEHTTACDVGGRVIGSSERQAAPGNTAVQAMAVHRLAVRLSPAELQVCLLLARNRSTKQIADMLNTAPCTIESHRRSIRRKLGLEPRANLVSFLVAEMGLPFITSAP